MRLKTLHIAFFTILNIFFQSNLYANSSKNSHIFATAVPCEENYLSGEISSNQTICLDDNLPSPIISLSNANNGIGDYEYMWIKTTVNPVNPSVVWASIPSATGASYSPPALWQTTWFRRCSRPVGCLIYGNESNEVKITVESCIDPCEAFKVNLVTKVAPTCHESSDGTIELSLEGGQAPFSINWNGSSATGLFAENLAKGIFSVEITDANGCYDSKIIELNAPDALKVNSFKSDATCFGTNDGWITLSAEGGTPPYTYIYNDVETTNHELRNLASGVYEILVTDANGCHNTSAVQIFEPTKIELTATTTPETCLQNDASIQVIVEGGLSPFYFQWDNEENTQDLQDLMADNYFLLVSDRNDCVATLEVTVDNDCAPVVIDFEEVMLQKMEDHSVKIEWIAHNETPSGVFVVERSIDNENFKIVGDPIGGAAFSVTGNHYYLMDDSPKNGLNHYRIRHYDNEGKMCISKINALFFANEETPEISIFPNPVVNKINFDFLQPTDNQVIIELSDTFGKTIMSKVVAEGMRFSTIEVANLPAGTYFTQVINENSRLTKKIIKE